MAGLGAGGLRAGGSANPYGTIAGCRARLARARAAGPSAAPIFRTPLILYEHPLNEGIRTMLRLEHLFDRLGQLIGRDTPLDHHYALATLFEAVDVASRADLKADLLKELERQKTQLDAYRGNPSISPAALDGAIARIDRAWHGLNGLVGKAAQAPGGPEWLAGLRSRVGIPGGTCAFDLPAYHAWQQADAPQRRGDLLRWSAPLAPLAEALRVLLGLLRDTGVPQRVAASGGRYQQSLPAGRNALLLRLRLDRAARLVPEISGHRLMVQVRLMAQDSDGRLRPSGSDAPFELTLCA